MTFYYLASPYTHPDFYIQNDRYNAAEEAAFALFSAGYPTYSPILHWHPTATEYDPNNLLGGHYWELANLPFLIAAKTLILLPLEGWRRSRGVRRELEAAKTWKLPTLRLDATSPLKLESVHAEELLKLA